MTTQIKITCRDPIVSRDGRPFGSGQSNRMRSAGWPLPSVVAGSLRSTIGKVENREFSVATAQELLQIEVAGVFPLAGEQLYLPAPQDCVIHPDQGPLRMAPHTVENAGCDLPASGLRPVGLTEAQALNDFKPVDAPAWWPVERYAAWLTGDNVAFDEQFLGAPEVEDLTHVQLDAEAGAAEDGNLFTTTALSLTHLPRHGSLNRPMRADRYAAITLSARARASNWCANTAATLDAMHPLGGERRLVHWTASEDAVEAWRCPQRIRESLSSASRVRMTLATPAIFRDGWKSAWLDDDLVGQPPGADVLLRLVGVSVQRWRAVSGWSLADLPGQPRGPKPVKRVVPAGGVYFFEIAGGSASALADRWLEPVSDDEQDRRDGFGLAIWGIW